MVTPPEKSGDRYAELTALFRAAAAGDEAAYGCFLETLSRFLRPLIARRLPAADVEDVLQETLVSVHKARHTHDGERPLMPWLLAIMQFRVNDHLRRLYARAEHETGAGDLPEPAAEDVTNGDAANESVEELLKGVPEREQRILTLMYLEGHTAKETGARLHMGESAVKVAGHRALRKLRDLWGKE